jgi:hypothetical protein
MRLRIHRSDGKTGSYHQGVASRAALLLKRLDPQRIFSSGPIVIGVLNPFSVINADEVFWIEIETDLSVTYSLPEHIETVRKLAGREEYEALLSQQWPHWMKFKKSKLGDLLEALVELSFRSGESVFLHVTGKITNNIPMVDAFFHKPVIMASYPPNGTVYINPKCIVRSRVYHSRHQVDFPEGLWFAEADDVSNRHARSS